MTSDLLMEEAQAIWDVLGEHGSLWLASRIDRLVAIGNAVEAERLVAIGRCFSRLSKRHLH